MLPGRNLVAVLAAVAGAGALAGCEPEEFAAQIEASCSEGATFVSGTDGADTFRGSSGRDFYNADAGNDNVGGGSNHDCLSGGPGSDTVNGGSGNDLIVEFGSGDTVIGGSDDDTIFVFPFAISGADDGWASGPTRLFGGSGDDVVSGADGAGDDTLDCGSGHDQYAADEGDVVASNCEEALQLPAD